MDLSLLLDSSAWTFIKTNAIGVFWVAVVFFGGRALLSLAARGVVRRVDDGNDAVDTGAEKRAKTLAGIVRAAGNVLIILVSFIMTMQLFGVNPMPILAGASVMGFAIGFGAQTLIKDFLAGIFILAENQFAVGDKVKIGAMTGTVHRMSMRSTVLVDEEGNLVFLPNGAVTSVVNYSLGAHERELAARVAPAKAAVVAPRA